MCLRVGQVPAWKTTLLSTRRAERWNQNDRVKRDWGSEWRYLSDPVLDAGLSPA